MLHEQVALAHHSIRAVDNALRHIHTSCWNCKAGGWSSTEAAELHRTLGLWAAAGPLEKVQLRKELDGLIPAVCPHQGLFCVATHQQRTESRFGANPEERHTRRLRNAETRTGPPRPPASPDAGRTWPGPEPPGSKLLRQQAEAHESRFRDPAEAYPDASDERLWRELIFRAYREGHDLLEYSPGAGATYRVPPTVPPEQIQQIIDGFDGHTRLLFTMIAQDTGLCREWREWVLEARGASYVWLCQ